MAETKLTVALARALAMALQHLETLKTWDTFQNTFNWTREHYDSVQADAEARLSRLCNFLPHGSGIDNGVELDRARSNSQRLVLNTSFHHMDGNGFYDGWTDHTVTVTPDLTAHAGFKLRITGRNRNDIKDYLYDLFDTTLSMGVEPYGV